MKVREVIRDLEDHGGTSTGSEQATACFDTPTIPIDGSIPTGTVAANYRQAGIPIRHLGDGVGGPEAAR